MAERRVRFGIAVAQVTGACHGIRDARSAADRLIVDAARADDHLPNRTW